MLAVKRGYIIDSANVNLKKDHSVLKYIGSDKMLHITESKVDVYQFTIDRNAKPQRIVLKSTDSIKIDKP